MYVRKGVYIYNHKHPRACLYIWIYSIKQSTVCSATELMTDQMVTPKPTSQRCWWRLGGCCCNDVTATSFTRYIQVMLFCWSLHLRPEGRCSLRCGALGVTCLRGQWTRFKVTASLMILTVCSPFQGHVWCYRGQPDHPHWLESPFVSIDNGDLWNKRHQRSFRVICSAGARSGQVRSGQIPL